VTGGRGLQPASGKTVPHRILHTFTAPGRAEPLPPAGRYATVRGTEPLPSSPFPPVVVWCRTLALPASYGCVEPVPTAVT